MPGADGRKEHDIAGVVDVGDAMGIAGSDEGPWRGEIRTGYEDCVKDDVLAKS
jgi:hypothetical protein